MATDPESQHHNPAPSIPLPCHLPPSKVQLPLIYAVVGRALRWALEGIVSVQSLSSISCLLYAPNTSGNNSSTISNGQPYFVLHVLYQRNPHSNLLTWVILFCSFYR